jgi:hypothetical protein
MQFLDVDVAIAVPVNIAALIDDTDFITPETAVAYNAAGMALVWNFTTTAGVFTQTAVVPTTAGVHDWTHEGKAVYTLEIPASAGTINNDTEGYGFFSGTITGVLPFTGPTFGFRAAALNNALVDGGAVLGVNIESSDDIDLTATQKASVNTEADTAITDAALATAANLATVDTVVDSILVDTATTIPATIATVDSNVDAILVDTSTTIPATITTLTTNVATVDTVVDGIQTDLSNATDGLGALKALIDTVNTDLANGTDGLGALKTLIDTVDTVVDGIQTDLSNGTDGLGALKSAIDTVDTNVDAVLVDTATTIPASLTNLSNQTITIDGIVDSILVDTGTTIPATITTLTTNVATVDTVVDSILEDTAAITPGGDATEAKQDTIIANLATVDSVADAILVDTGTTLPSTLGTIDGKIGIVDTIVDAILVDTDTTIPALIAALNNISVAQVNAEVDTALADYDSPTRTEATADKDEVITQVNTNEAKIDVIDTNVDSILVDTATTIPASIDALPTVTEITADMDANSTQLAALIVDTGTDIPALITALNNISTAQVNAEVDTALTDYDSPTRTEATADKDSIEALINALNNISAANVNAEMVGVMETDTHTELAAVPSATSSYKSMLQWVFALARNKITQTATTATLRNDDDNGSIATSTDSDNGITATRGEWTP